MKKEMSNELLEIIKTKLETIDYGEVEIKVVADYATTDIKTNVSKRYDAEGRLISNEFVGRVVSPKLLEYTVSRYSTLRYGSIVIILQGNKEIDVLTEERRRFFVEEGNK